LKNPYQHEWSKEKSRGLIDTLEREPIDFYTEEERNDIDAKSERHRIAELEKLRQSRRQLLADKDALKKLEKQSLIKRQEKWLMVWHIGLFIGSIIALLKIAVTLIENGT
jgi:Flp pilus assembly protein TadB